MTACPSLSPDGPFVRDLLGYVDCQARTIGASGYHALSATGSSVSAVLTALLTIFIALFGYRMLFGQRLTTRDTVLALVKVGIVMTLATSWSAYSTVIYDVAMNGPAELAADIGGSAALPGAGGGFVEHLQAVDDGLAELVRIGTGQPTDADLLPAPAQSLTREQEQQRLQLIGPRPRWDPQRDAEIVGSARTAYLTGALGALASVRLVTGLLLALGPFFALFLLFDGARGVFEGWIRALVGAALGSLTTTVLLGGEIGIFEPWLSAILAEREAGTATPAVPIELLAFSLIFALTLLAGLIAAAKIAHGFHLPATVRDASDRLIEVLRSTAVGERAMPSLAKSDVAWPERSRAAAIADAASAARRREMTITSFSAGSPANERGSNLRVSSRGSAPETAIPIGQSARRRITNRVSAGAKQRETR